MKTDKRAEEISWPGVRRKPCPEPEGEKPEQFPISSLLASTSALSKKRRRAFLNLGVGRYSVTLAETHQSA